MRTASPRFVRAAVTLLLAAPLVVGMSGCGMRSAMPGEDGGNYSAMPMESQDSSSAYDKRAGAAGAAYPGTTSSPAVTQQLVVTGSIRVAVDDPAAALEESIAIAKDLKGSAASTNVDNSGTYTSTSVTLRIPSDSYEAALDRISALGNVKEKQTNTEDIGALVADLDARIEALKVSIRRLTDLMENASSTADLIEAERELTNRQSELDAINAQRAWLADQVKYSTLDVTFRTKAGTEASSPSMWKESWDAFLEGIGVLVYAIVMFLPWLIVIVPVALLIRWCFKRRRARKEARERAGVGTAPVDSTTGLAPGAQGMPVTQTHSLPGQEASRQRTPESEANPVPTEPQAGEEPASDSGTGPAAE